MTTSGAAGKVAGTMLFNLPNLLTLSRIAAIPLVVACFWLDRGWAQWLSMALFVAAAVTDWFDGYFARRYHQISRLGRFLDPIADKLLVAAALLMLVDNGPLRGVHVLAALIILAREILVSGPARVPGRAAGRPAGQPARQVEDRRADGGDRRRCWSATPASPWVTQARHRADLDRRRPSP